MPFVDKLKIKGNDRITITIIKKDKNSDVANAKYVGNMEFKKHE